MDQLVGSKSQALVGKLELQLQTAIDGIDAGQLQHATDALTNLDATYPRSWTAAEVLAKAIVKGSQRGNQQESILVGVV